MNSDDPRWQRFEEFILLVEEVQGGEEQALLSFLTDDNNLDEFLDTGSVTVTLRGRKFELVLDVKEIK